MFVSNFRDFRFYSFRPHGMGVGRLFYHHGTPAGHLVASRLLCLTGIGHSVVHSICCSFILSSSHHLCLTGIGKYIWSWHTWLSIWLTEGHAQQVALPNRHRPFGRSFYLAGCPCVLADESVLSHGCSASCPAGSKCYRILSLA